MFSALLTAILALNADSTTWTFDDAKAGELPKGWTATKTGEGPGSVWKVVERGKQKVLAQTSADGPKPLFNLCVVDAPSMTDIELSLSVRARDGKIDQGGGPVWRYQDADNYYVCRWNPLEDNFRLYHVVDGKRTQLTTADVKVKTDEPHTIRVTHQGSRIACFLDGKKLLEADDKTIVKPGKIGVWSKADAVTDFDDVEIKPAQ